MMPWQSGHPRNDARYACAMYKDYRLHEEHCHNVNRFICKKGPTACAARWSCPKDWVRRGNKCYGGSSFGNFDQAVEHCKKLEAELLTIETAQENDWVISYIKDLKKKRQVYYWSSYWLGMLIYSTLVRLVAAIFAYSNAQKVQSKPFIWVTSKYLGSCWSYRKTKTTLLYQTTHSASYEPSYRSLRETFVK